ncbi:uncharacterized protein K02A2.6-like [Mizuhopecten yessoensis]|uniref:uncharacterized protein K02A2.6-like n=1 Tax=Mizuhopecten yessoensis TaxID=6573 RepID=UPI000B459402|nr:uncharacterized protein K02A2.6-like [Mizuhopecten yessoensis]
MTSLPIFPSFDTESDKSNAGPRWDRWIGRLENLLVALDITDEDENDRKRTLLLHYAGERVYDIYEAEKGETEPSYGATKQVLTTYFKPKKNQQMELYTFRSYKQSESQTLDEYVTELRRLAKDCGFADTNKEILSQVIQHCKSNRLRRRALREPDKDLNGIIILGRTLELSDVQATAMERDQSASVNAVGRAQSEHKPFKRKQHRSSNFKRGTSKQGESDKKCMKCGGSCPHHGDCPPKGQTCHSCGKSNHYMKMCRSRVNKPTHKGQNRNVKAVQQDTGHGQSVSYDARYQDGETDDDDRYCYGIKETLTNSEQVRFVNEAPNFTLKVNNRPLRVLLDSGSSVNILDETAYECMGRPPITRASNRLIPYGGGKPLSVLGKCDLGVETNKQFDTLTFYVVKGHRYGSILGYPSARNLSLIHVVSEIAEDVDKQVETEFPGIFKGIGKLRGTLVKLHIDPKIQPVAQRHRRTPFHLRDKVKKEIDKLVEGDIIEKVEGTPTPWISPIVTPPKKDPDEIRLCVDMREANKAIQRERHVLPTMDELIHDLNGATVFSKLDLRSGYHQLELDPKSRYITTFSTHVGIYQYKRLNFGISSASEVFQETIRQVIQGIDGAKNISDDILIFGRSRVEHDAVLRQVLQK